MKKDYFKNYESAFIKDLHEYLETKSKDNNVK